MLSGSGRLFLLCQAVLQAGNNYLNYLSIMSFTLFLTYANITINNLSFSL